jgi:hypothetical protein
MDYRKILILLVIILLVILLILLIKKKSEGWIPMVWNIPTREIYPPLYYDLRCPPPVYHYYRKTKCPKKIVYLNNPVVYRNPLYDCPYDF